MGEADFVELPPDGRLRIVDEDKCPKCGEECDRDEVDVGVGVIYGPYGCPMCGWSESSEYDRSGGTSPAQADNPGWYVDQFGGMRRISAIADSLERFGIPRRVAEEVFGGEKTER